MKNYFQVQEDIFEYGLSPYDIAVYCYLAMRRNRKTGTAWPAIASIAEACKMGESTVRRSLRILREKGLIQVEQHYQSTRRGNRQTANIYTVPGLDAYGGGGTSRKENGEGVAYGEGINKTISNTTKLIEPSSSQPGLDDEEYVMLKRECLFHPEEACNYRDAPLLERALDALWGKKAVKSDGITYDNAAIQRLVLCELSPEVLRDAEECFMGADNVKSPVGYLANCILSSAINYDSKIAALVEKHWREGKW